MQVSYSCLNIIRQFHILKKPVQFPLTVWWQLRLWSDNCHYVSCNHKWLRVKWHAVHFPLFDHLIWRLPVPLQQENNRMWLRVGLRRVLLWGGWCWGASWDTLGEARSCRGKPRHRNRNLVARVQRSAIQRGYPAGRENVTLSTYYRNVHQERPIPVTSHVCLKWQHWQ